MTVAHTCPPACMWKTRGKGTEDREGGQFAKRGEDGGQGIVGDLSSKKGLLIRHARICCKGTEHGRECAGYGWDKNGCDC